MTEHAVFRKGIWPLVMRSALKSFIAPTVIFGLVNNIQVRHYAARKGTRERAAKKKVKKEEVKESFMEMYLKQKKKIVTIPGRYNVDCWLRRPPDDDVYRQKFYKEIVYSFDEAIALLREIHHPTMYNSPDSNIYSTVELDMKLPKKNRYMDKFHGFIQYPHTINTGVERKVLAICENVEDQQKAAKAGAWFSGGTNVVKQIQAGEIKTSDFDHLVIHVDSLMELSKLRGILKGKFPSKARGNVGTDIVDLVDKFYRGIEFGTTKHPVELDFGWIDELLGQLSMSTEHLEANFHELLKCIHSNKPKGDMPGSFITRVLLYSKISGEKFSVSPWKYLPEDARKSPQPKVSEDEEELEKEDISDETRVVL